MKRVFLLYWFLLMGISPVLAQQIKGKVRDAAGKPVESVSVSLKDKDGNTLSFTRSAENGDYTISVKDPNQTGLRIEASSLGYRKKVEEVTSLSKTYDLVLESSQIELDAVTVKHRPTLTTNGDTLNYRTSDFADKQDRTIGDALKRMPGIEVAESGKISYNGKSISNLYIDGDNLLDDKYNVATKSIPQGAVDKVQVIQNDQPVKMLQKNNMSDDVALNLVIKDDAKFKVMGDAIAGAGTPEKFDGNVSAMMFNKNLKFVNNIKGNNIGIDPGMDVAALNFSDYLRRLEATKPNSLLSTGAAGVPTLPQNRSLLNRAGLVNLNNMYKFTPDLQLKANVSYLYDERSQRYNKFSETYLPGQTVSYSEVQNNNLNPQKLQTQLNLNENTTQHYLNNSLRVDYLPSRSGSEVVINNNRAYQSLKQETLDISNEFNYRKKLKSENTINLYSFLNKISQPETLVVTPGLNPDITNNGQPYAGLNQFLEQPAFFTNNYAAFALVKNGFSQVYKGGFSIQQQHIESELYKTQNDGSNALLSADAVNNLSWQKTRFYTEGTYEFKNDKVTASLALPLSYNLINYSDPGAALDKSLQRLFLNPALNVRYKTGIETEMNMNYLFRNELGGVNDVYRGVILRNYRSFFANNSPLSEIKTHSVGAGYNFRKAMQMLFLSIGGSYSDASLNTISSMLLTDNVQQSIAMPLSNHIRNLGLNVNASKYLFDLRSTINVGVSYSQSRYDQLQNNQLLPFVTRVTTYKAGVESKVTNFINWSYNATYSFMNNEARVINGVETNNHQWRQQSTLAITTVKNVYLNLSGEHIFTRQSKQPDLNYLFADANVRYRLLKMKTDLEFGITNLANIKTFDAINLSANALTTGSYVIPGRIGMIKMRFNF